MSTSFRKPPLVELIVDLRWQTPGPLVDSGLSAQGGDPPYSFEQLFMHFGAVVSEAGYTNFERLIPAGFPLLPFQAAYRYRPSLEKAAKQSTLYQLGNGVFSINATPPNYRSWLEFSEVIRDGISYLHRAFERVNHPAPTFSAAIVRYIDAFRGDLFTPNQSLPFITETLGFKIELPDVVRELCVAPDQISPNMVFAIPVEIGQLQFALAEGIVENERSVIMDCSVIMQRDMGNQPEEVVNHISQARDVIHKLFIGMTAPLHRLMDPVEVT